MEKYKVGKILGDGTFGSVTKATNMQTGEIVAIKKMKKKVTNWDECIRLQEIKTLIKLSHPNIVRLFEIIKHNNELYFIFEFMERNVYQLTKDRQQNPLNETEVRNVIYQTLQGLEYMHRHGFFHRDLKPENLLEYHNTVKLADFGLAKDINAKPPFTDYVSTRWYRAPEVILRAPGYNAPIDIFAIGAIMGELYKNWPLFPGSSESDQIIKICQVMGTPSKEDWPDGYKLAKQVGFVFPSYKKQPLRQLILNASDDAIELMEMMLQYNPFKRPTAIECLQHRYFQCHIPIPQNIQFEKPQQPMDSDKLFKQEEIQPKQQQIQNNQQFQQKDNIVTKIDGNRSGYYLRNSRYKPGVSSNKQIEQ